MADIPTAPILPKTPIPIPVYNSPVTANYPTGQSAPAKFDPNTGKPLTAPTVTPPDPNIGKTGRMDYSDPTKPNGVLIPIDPATGKDITQPTSGTDTTKSTIGTDSTLSDSTDRASLAKAEADYQAQATQVQNTITNIQNGTTPLTAGEQAQVDGLKQQFQALIDQQGLANTGASGAGNIRGYQTGSAEYDPSFQVKTIGSIVSAGQNKIADLNIKMASAVASLTQSFKDNDIKAVQDAWDIYKDASKNRTDALQKTIDDTTKAIKDAKDAKIAADKVQYDEVTKPIQDTAADALKNGAPKDVVAAINAAPDVNSALAAAGEWLQTATGTLGEYLQYKRDTEGKGLTPMDYTSYKDAQDKKASQLKINEAYATENAKNQADANSTSSDKVQQKLEQQYRQVLSKEFSSRTGALGVENAKVNQANHLNSLFSQYYDPKTGNYNIPQSQYAELAIGLANLVSGSGQATEGTINNIMQATAKGKLNQAISYATGMPQNGSTQAVFKNLIDSVDRQAETATQNREAALQNMRDQAPTDLDPSRIDKLNKSTEMVPYAGVDRIAKSKVDNYVKANPKEADKVAKLYEVPGATDEDIYEYLGLQ